MNHMFWSFIALDLARERAEEATRYRQFSAELEAGPSLWARVRRFAARGVAALSRGSAWVVRRLDDCIADELGRTLAPTE